MTFEEFKRLVAVASDSESAIIQSLGAESAALTYALGKRSAFKYVCKLIDMLEESVNEKMFTEPASMPAAPSTLSADFTTFIRN